MDPEWCKDNQLPWRKPFQPIGPMWCEDNHLPKGRGWPMKPGPSRTYAIPPKREVRRLETPCENCRRRKRKCMPEGSGCQMCSERGLPCTGPVKRSSLQSRRRSKSPDRTHKDECDSVASALAALKPCSHGLPQTFHLHVTDMHGVLHCRNISADRSSLPKDMSQGTCGQCNRQRVPTSVFDVSGTYLKLNIFIQSDALRSGLEEVLGKQPWAVEKCFDIKVLLTHYAILKGHLQILRYLEAT
ncbi:hypothetical protein F4802DRAFT_416370 [Xylaria palmicola]|nr:hypothetical protein F4802DRAFT_416370 [Xylaria palmicola]